MVSFFQLVYDTTLFVEKRHIVEMLRFSCHLIIIVSNITVIGVISIYFLVCIKMIHPA